MKADKTKFQIALARSCMTVAELTAKSGLPRPTVNNVICGREVRPATIGMIAKALRVDVVDIIDLEVS